MRSLSMALAAGVAQFGIVGTVSFSQQRAAGADLQLVYAVVQKKTGRLVFDGKRDDIASPADLDGKIYAGFGGAWAHAFTNSMQGGLMLVMSLIRFCRAALSPGAGKAMRCTWARISKWGSISHV